MAYFAHFTEKKIGARLKEVQEAIVRDRLPLELRLSRAPAPAWQQPDFDASGWQIVSAGTAFTAKEETIFLRALCQPRPDWRGMMLAVGLAFGSQAHRGGTILADEKVYAEALLYLDGRLLQAADHYHRQITLTQRLDSPAPRLLAAALYVGLGGRHPMPGEPESLVTIELAELRALAPEARQLYFDMYAAYHSALSMDKSSAVYTRILGVLDEVTEILDFRDGRRQAFYRSAAEAREYLQHNFYGKFGAAPELSPELWSVGHAHIDNAWLWRLSHTRKKCERTWSTVIRNMRDYPEYKFSCSQAQQYQYVKEDNPELYAAIKEAVAAGRWEPVGGMWVESDTNLVSGESLVRQFLHGTRFFKDEFGVRSRVVWLPDVFGYSAALPQIMKKAGFDYFATIKIAWSQVNKPAYHTFFWEGIDGTRILTHFAPQGDYNCLFTPEQVKESWKRYRQNDLTRSALYIYGHGDGGGGPSVPMLETAARLADFPEMPRVRLTTVEAFFDDLAAQVQQHPEVPRWAGELYLEYHRGTYTTQAWIKHANRRAENALMTAEQLASLAWLLCGKAYPQSELRQAWEIVLRNQFHDVVTGSSIHHVYRDAAHEYAKAFELIEREICKGMEVLAANISGPADRVLIFNPLSWRRRDVVKAPPNLPLPGQPVQNLDGSRSLLVGLSGAPSLGFTVLKNGAAGSPRELKVSLHELENEFFAIRFDEHAEIASLVDKRCGREVIDTASELRGNSILAFEDKPLEYDAWDIDIFYREKRERVQYLDWCKPVEEGPLRAAIELQRTFGRGSVIRQRICIYRDMPRIDFETKVDWRERQTLLKAAFPVTVHSRHATYDIQFGVYERPTHWNTPWDWARFEVYGHKWADLSEAGYGVSLLNDSKYGWDIKDNTIRLTLLRSPIDPDPLADLGIHYFTYSLYPHAGSWREGGTCRAAYELNVPPRFALTRGGQAIPEHFSLFEPLEPNLIAETVKLSEDGQSLVVRLYETFGLRGLGRICTDAAVKRIDEISLLEDESWVSDLPRGPGGEVLLRCAPFEMKTFRLGAEIPNECARS